MLENLFCPKLPPFKVSVNCLLVMFSVVGMTMLLSFLVTTNVQVFGFVLGLFVLIAIVIRFIWSEK